MTAPVTPKSEIPVEEIRKKRAERLIKAQFEIGRPDRVPYATAVYYFAARYSGITYYEFDFDYDKNLNAILKVAKDFNFDSIASFGGGVVVFFPVFILGKEQLEIPLFSAFGTFHDILGDKYTKWPGRELGINTRSQIAYIDMPYMKEDEYDEFSADPVKFIVEKLIPRAYRNLEKPGSPKYYATLIRLGIECWRANQYFARLSEGLRSLGYPSMATIPAIVANPLDFLADFIRGHVPTMLDLRRRPDKVMKAIEAISNLIEESIDIAIEWWRKTEPIASQLFDIPIPTAASMLHLNEMLPPKLFEKFYWEPFKPIIKKVTDAGIRLIIAFEGNFTPFLEYILELPKGMIVGLFERSDLRRVREVLGTHIAIYGGISPAHFIHGTPQKVYEETCKLLNEVKEPGGFVFGGTGIGIPDEAKPENVSASIEAVEKCGTY